MFSEQWLVIANPAAGSGRVGRHWRSLEPWLRKHLDRPAIILTKHPGHATEMAKEGVSLGFRRLIAIGGDGTCHEIVNGVFQQEKVDTIDITLALLPIGTGNDWRKTHHIPDRGAAWLEMLHSGRTVVQDIGMVHFLDAEGDPANRFFINVAGMAFDAYVVQQINKKEGSRFSAGFYLLLLLRHLMNFVPGAARVDMNGRKFQNDFFTIEIGIGRYAGGGMEVLPHAVSNDGFLAVTLARNTPKWEVLLNIWRFFNGSIGKHRNIELHQAREVTVIPAGESPIPLEADGEFLGNGPAEFCIIPEALRVIVP